MEISSSGRASDIGLRLVLASVVALGLALVCRAESSFFPAQPALLGDTGSSPTFLYKEARYASVAIGRNHVLLLHLDGTLSGWGSNTYGQRDAPEGRSVFVAVAARGHQSLALKPDGTVLGWGQGAGFVPPGLANVTAIAAGEYHALALRADGTVVAWGHGDAATVPSTLAGVVAIAAGTDHSLALKADGTVVAWGLSEPLVTSGLTGVRAIAAGDQLSLVLLNDGSLFQLSYHGVTLRATSITAVAAGGKGADKHVLALRVDGTVMAWQGDFTTPIPVPDGLTSVAAIAVGDGAFLALKSDGNLVRWAYNYNIPAVPISLPGIRQISVGGPNAAVLLADGTVVPLANRYYDGDNRGTLPVPANLESVIAIAAGVRHNLAIRADGTIIGWGFNSHGQTNNPVGGLPYVAVATGEFHSLALRANGTVVAWGRNDYGQTLAPEGLASITAIAAGDYHNLALHSDGTIRAWGGGDNGESEVPEELGPAMGIAAGSRHSLALLRDGTVRAWGDNSHGQIDVPPGLSDVIAVTAGVASSGALRRDGTIAIWGRLKARAAEFEGIKHVSGLAMGGNAELAESGSGTDGEYILILVGDSDEDELYDQWENSYIAQNAGDLLTSLDQLSPGGDWDGDGLAERDEYAYGTNPILADTDGDDFTDGFETRHGLSPLAGNAASIPFLVTALKADSMRQSSLGVFTEPLVAARIADDPAKMELYQLYHFSALGSLELHASPQFAPASGQLRIQVDLFDKTEGHVVNPIGNSIFMSPPLASPRDFFRVRAAP